MSRIFSAAERKRAGVVFCVCILVYVGATIIAARVQTDAGRTVVSNVYFTNETGISVRAKLSKPLGACETSPMPGVVFIHGYQSTRETGDALSIELSRRGFVVLAIDAIGRGNSGLPGPDPKAPDFDDTFGGRASLAYLKSLPFVKSDSVGMVGHSLGAEMSYEVALADPSVKALVIIGFAYTEEATPESPKNMLMIIGQLDEFRDRMTGTRNIAAEWMGTSQTRRAIAATNPELGVTYGSIERGTGRRVVVPDVIHIQETHSSLVVAETLDWMKQALGPADGDWLDVENQIWSVKEWCTLIAMLACFTAMLPLALLLLGIPAFGSLRGPAGGEYACSRRDYLRHARTNGMIMWLYLPAALIIFGIHKYAVPIDGVFPMMVVNATVWWFVMINIIGFFLFRRWVKKQALTAGLTLADLGISWNSSRLVIDSGQILKTIALAALLFGFAYGSEHLLEAIFIVDFRFIFAFASDLTADRAKLFLLYFPFLLAGFLQLGFFLHGQLRLPRRRTYLETFTFWTWRNLLALVVPLLLFMAIQYVPLLTTGAIPLVGPGGMFVLFMINMFHIIGVLIIVVPISTWCYLLTGRPYLGAILCAAIVAWMFTSSQVIAPVPID